MTEQERQDLVLIKRLQATQDLNNRATAKKILENCRANGLLKTQQGVNFLSSLEDVSNIKPLNYSNVANTSPATISTSYSRKKSSVGMIITILIFIFFIIIGIILLLLKNVSEQGKINNLISDGEYNISKLPEKSTTEYTIMAMAENVELTKLDTKYIDTSETSIEQSIQHIKKGNKGKSVKDLQIKLRDIGLYTGKINGTFDLNTEVAVKKLQENYNLIIDGIVQGETWVALENSLQAIIPTQSPTQAPTQSPTQAPTQSPTQAPTQSPTQAPTQSPTQAPTQRQFPTDSFIYDNDYRFAHEPPAIHKINSFKITNIEATVSGYNIEYEIDGVLEDNKGIHHDSYDIIFVFEFYDKNGVSLGEDDWSFQCYIDLGMLQIGESYIKTGVFNAPLETVRFTYRPDNSNLRTEINIE